MPEKILLSEREPLVFKTARWLITLSAQRPLDLSHCAVLVPTAGSGRRLRAELVRLAAERGKGLLSPVVSTPMGLLRRAAGEKVAGGVDTLLAWTQVISEVTAESFPLLLSGFSDHRALASRIGQSLRELCALLAEAELTPVSAYAQCASAPQEDRWKELKSLYEHYLNRLAAAGLEDPGAARIRVAKKGIVPDNIQHVMVAGVPDLNRIAEVYLRTLESAGVVGHRPDRRAKLRRETVRRLGKARPESLVAEISPPTFRRFFGCCRSGIRGASCCRFDRVACRGRLRRRF